MGSLTGADFRLWLQTDIQTPEFDFRSSPNCQAHINDGTIAPQQILQIEVARYHLIDFLTPMIV